MLTPFDDYPIHQTSLPIAHAGAGHADQYDRFWFNGYDAETFFAVAFGLYPNRGVMDGAFSVVRDGVQRSVFVSGRIPLDRTRTSLGPISIEIIEPLRVTRVTVDAPDHGLVADLTAQARTAACEEQRTTRYQGTKLAMDVTRATQLVNWSGQLSSGGSAVDFTGPVYGTRDRSWGIRPAGDPAPAAPAAGPGQIFFLWAPLNFADECLHYTVFEDEAGRAWSQTAAVLPVLGPESQVFGPDTGIRRLDGVRHAVRWAPGLRRSTGATLLLPAAETVELEPLNTFRMKGVGYLHPTWAHGRWHGDLVVGGEVHTVAELDTTAPDCVHVQQVMRATWGDRVGLGVLEQLVVGPYKPAGFQGLFAGAPG